MTDEAPRKPMERPVMFQNIKRPAAGMALDLAGLPASKPKPPVDGAALQAVQARHGFTDRDGGAGEGAVPIPAARPGPEPAAVVAPTQRLHRSGRVMPIGLRTTADYHARFLSMCDRLSDAHGRKITQSEAFEMSLILLEKNFEGRE